MQRVVALLRISQDDEDIHNQEYALEKCLKAKEWMLVAEPFRLEESGSKGFKWVNAELIEERPEVRMMVQWAKEGKFDILWVYHHDRLTRGGGTDLMNYTRQFASAKIQIYDDQEGKFLPMDEDAMREIMQHLNGFGARVYREEVIRKTKNALESRKAMLAKDGFFISKEGRRVTHLGTPSKEVDMERVIELKNKGFSLRGIAKELGVAPNTIRSKIKDYEIKKDMEEIK